MFNFKVNVEIEKILFDELLQPVLYLKIILGDSTFFRKMLISDVLELEKW